MTGFWRRILGKSSPPVAAESTLAASDGASILALQATKAAVGLQGYELQRELGRGAMAVVHLARQLSNDKLVAIKRLALQREFAAEDLADVRQRFMREARAAGHLQHPDILQVLDAGEAGEDAWIAMEFVQGKDLSHYTRANQLLPVREVVRIGARLARALHYAHSQGVIHRDIKPANVMLDLANDVLKIMDFGIARIADGSRTRTGLVLGTPSFMSPEQLAGLKVDGRSDLYSLGAMIYQLLTGHLPHQSDSMARLMYQIANQTPADVRHYRPGLPEALAMVLALALEKRPELRYASGEQMALDLEAVLLQPGLEEPVAAPPISDMGTDSPISADSFAQTVRLNTLEAGQNPAGLQPKTKP
ncbi:serine/threonine-protein kinase [Roseateles oligotrophus]|uniref:Serine/threonine protein kinase n=1 Tax=Roseateles oligotrophus TaxID=1769250 RepID=A0ABT2YKU0_9BURK|nr:serine/threonine-protein kinase [Roseateles oligotrophus]MCV2370685.1 serine/threonine protein kinase [Roseateles oligotrophus]